MKRKFSGFFGSQLGNAHGFCDGANGNRTGPDIKALQYPDQFIEFFVFYRGGENIRISDLRTILKSMLNSSTAHGRPDSSSKGSSCPIFRRSLNGIFTLR
jgi:hypothetical protein